MYQSEERKININEFPFLTAAVNIIAKITIKTAKNCKNCNKDSKELQKLQ